MEVVIALLAGALFGIGVHLLQQRGILRLALGVAMIGHGAHLALLTAGGLQRGAPPITHQDAAAYADPLPQALVLTAIVIGFGVTGFLLVLSYRVYQETRSDDLEALRDPDERVAELERGPAGEGP